MLGKYFKTDDGGKTWSNLRLPEDEAIYQVFVSPDKKVWMGGSSGKISYSDDLAKTWKIAGAPFDKDSRMHRIHMSDANSGIAAALDGDVLLVTSDNWKSFTKIPSPRAQGALKMPELKIAKGSFEEKMPKEILLREYTMFHHVGVAGDKYFVTQGGSVFWSSKTGIKWAAMEGLGFQDFLIDPASKNIYLVDAGGCIQYGPNEKSLKKATGACIKGKVVDLKSLGGALYAFDSHEIIYRFKDGNVDAGKPLPRQ